ncbi:hypothetical protein [Nocardia salmonicida]|uniref:hypothetical protein n=1 Tax=Nocardia salmonicida TaxID=53431 RepID=UPI000A78F7D2|nr:hypothetical protein [Nocardia salmonicida]
MNDATGGSIGNRPESGSSALAAMYTGLGLSVITTIVPYATRQLLAEHIRDGYPSYTQTQVDSAVGTYLVVLTTIGALGTIAWLWSIWTVRAGKRWARPIATALAALGATVGLTELLTRDTSGDTGLPPLLGWVLMTPPLVGLLAVVLLWRQPPPDRRGRTSTANREATA